LALVPIALDASLAGTAVLPPELTLSKHKSGPYTEGLSMNLQPGKVKDVYERARNSNGAQLEYRLTGPSQVLDYRFKYFKANGTNITSEVTGTGYEFPIGDRAKKFRARVRLPSNGDPDFMCAFFELHDDLSYTMTWPPSTTKPGSS
jgi:hypothetical protein